MREEILGWSDSSRRYEAGHAEKFAIMYSFAFTLCRARERNEQIIKPGAWRSTLADDSWCSNSDEASMIMTKLRKAMRNIGEGGKSVSYSVCSPL
jgi:hypothetical protein